MLKVKMVVAAELEIKRMKSDLNHHFFQSMVHSARLILLNRDHSTPELPDYALCHFCLDTYVSKLCAFLDFDEDTVFAKFKTDFAPDLEAYDKGSTPQAFRVKYAKDSAILFHLMKEIYMTRWKTKLEEMNAKEKANILEQASRSLQKHAVTEKVAAAVTMEDTVDRQTIEDLIQERVTAATKKLQANIGRLENKLSRTPTDSVGGKNQPGGAKQASRASPTERKTNMKPPGTTASAKKPAPRKTKTKENEAASAAAADNASKKPKQNAKAQKPKKPGNGKPTKATVSFKS
jgi:hypothetical protein